MSESDTLIRLQAWYSDQCDGEWEHGFGVSVKTLDNPGWAVSIDLAGTELDPTALSSIEDHRSDLDWIVCRVDGERFEAFGGPKNLDEMLAYFLDQANA